MKVNAIVYQFAELFSSEKVWNDSFVIHGKAY